MSFLPEKRISSNLVAEFSFRTSIPTAASGWTDGRRRRRRTPGNDWCVVQLGLRGIIKQIDIDTNHFLGNHPPFASLDALRSVGWISETKIRVPWNRLSWTPVLAQSPLEARIAKSVCDLTNDQTWTHVRLNIFPDGGVARLRVYGIVVPDWSKVKPGELVDLAAVENGGVRAGLQRYVLQFNE